MNSQTSNELLRLLNERRSVRHFTGEAIPEAHLEAILRAAEQAPTSVGAQQISLVVTRDKSKIAKIAEIAGGQPQVAGADVFVTVVIDFQRTAEASRLGGSEQQIEQSAEGVLVGAIDAGIMVQAIQTAASALGYGSTAIGGIRRDPQALIELLELPAKTFPIVGTTLGVTDPQKPGAVKPRVPLESFAMNERYDLEAVKAGVVRYDATLRQWWDEQGLPQMPSYAKATAGYYQQVYFRHMAQALEAQGLLFKDH